MLKTCFQVSGKLFVLPNAFTYLFKNYTHAVTHQQNLIMLLKQAVLYR